MRHYRYRLSLRPSGGLWRAGKDWSRLGSTGIHGQRSGPVKKSCIMPCRVDSHNLLMKSVKPLHSTTTWPLKSLTSTWTKYS